MQYKFSPSTAGFYLDDVHGDSIPADSIGVSQQQRDEIMRAQAAGKLIGPDLQPQDPPPFTPEQFQQMVGHAVDQMLDELAQSWRYQNSTRLLAAKGSSNAKFSAEGSAFEAYWAACWTVLDDLEAAVMAGTAQMPSTVAEVLALLPAAPSRPT